MTVALFVTLLAIFSTCSSLITQAVKQLCEGMKWNVSSNILAFVVSCVVGIGGTATEYALTNIPFTTGNIVCMCLMGLACAVASMVGYDKVIQTVKQIAEKKNGE